MTDHMFVLNPPSRSIRFWSPWKCVCGVGGTGADDQAAEYQYSLHLRGFWPAYTEPGVPGTEPVVVDGKLMWVKP